MDSLLRKLATDDTILARRILKRCRDSSRGKKVQQGGQEVLITSATYSPERYDYYVPEDAYQEELAIRIAQIEEARLATVRAYEERLNHLRVKFSHLDLEVAEYLTHWGGCVRGSAEVGYQFGIATRSYWRKLGYRASGEPIGHLVRGRQLFPTYGSQCLRELKTRSTIETVREDWTRKYGSEDVVLAEAIRFANRLQKGQEGLQLLPPEGYLDKTKPTLPCGWTDARLEERRCQEWECEIDCSRCLGLGTYSRPLFEHHFKIDGREYCFHSYEKPRHVSSTPGLDLPRYGRPFNSADLPIPPQSLVIALIRQLLEKPVGPGIASPCGRALAQPLHHKA